MKRLSSSSWASLLLPALPPLRLPLPFRLLPPLPIAWLLPLPLVLPAVLPAACSSSACSAADRKRGSSGPARVASGSSGGEAGPSPCMVSSRLKWDQPNSTDSGCRLHCSRAAGHREGR